MVRRLEKLAEASKNLFGKAVVGTSLSLAALTLSPDRAEGQRSKVCYDDPTYELHAKHDGHFYEFTMNVQGKTESFWVQDDLVSASGDCYHIDQGRTVRTSYRGETALATPSFVRSRNQGRNSRNSRNRSDVGKTLETANDVANIASGVAAIVDLFSGNDNSNNNNASNSKPDRNVSYRNPNKAEDSPYVDGSSGSSKEKESSSSSTYSNESPNVRNSQGERHESPYVSDKGSSSGESLYEMENKKDESSKSSDESLYEMKNENKEKSSPYESSNDRRKVADVSPGLMAGNSNLRKFGEAPLAGDLYDAKQNVEDMQGDSNPIDNWYDKNLRRANDYFGCGDPASKETSFLCWEAMPNSNSDYNDLAKIATYKLIPK